MKITTFNEGESLNADKLSQLIDADSENKLLADTVSRGLISSGTTWNPVLTATSTSLFTEKFYLSNYRNLKVILISEGTYQPSPGGIITNQFVFDFYLTGTKVNNYTTSLSVIDSALAPSGNWEYVISYSFPLINVAPGPYSLALWGNRRTPGVNVTMTNTGLYIMDMGKSI